MVSHDKIQIFPNLTHLSLSDLVIEEFQLAAFPNVISVSLANCHSMNEEELLFVSWCPTLKHLALSRTKSAPDAVRFLGSVNRDQRSCNLPNMRSKSFADNADSFQLVVQRQWSKLTSFELKDTNETVYNEFISASNDRKFPNLIRLNLTCKRGKGINIDMLNVERIAHLKYLTLQGVMKSPVQVWRLGEKIAK